MKRIVDKDFFDVKAIELAKKLVGKWLVHIVDGQKLVGQICETESYCGVNDSACHSYKNKKTERTKVMWEKSGIIYVYLCYGLHEMFNIVCGGESPEAVLIRGVVGHVGPSRATKFLKIDRSLNGKNIVDNDEIYLMDDGKKYDFVSTARIGIDYALKEDRDAKLRFVLKV